jgi:hypothetical protein
VPDREKEERMWRLAERMARSGKHASYMTIEWELTSLGVTKLMRC